MAEIVALYITGVASRFGACRLLSFGFVFF